MADDVTRLRSASGRLLERELFVCTVPELELLEAVGEPSSDAPFEDGPPKLYWDLEWPCGLVMALEFDQLTQRLTAHLDAPEVEHALRHLGFEPRDLWLLEVERPDRFAEQAAPPDRGHAVWASDEHGVAHRVAGTLTERDAECWRDELAAEDDGLTYWVQAEHPGQAPPRPPRDEVDARLIARLARPRGDGAASAGATTPPGGPEATPDR